MMERRPSDARDARPSADRRCKYRKLIVISEGIRDRRQDAGETS